MKTRNYNEHEVVAQLNKKHDIKISNGVVSILTGSAAKNDIGIKSKGKIDFLQKRCRYAVVTVRKF